MLFFFSFVSAFAVPILILERRSPSDSLKRAWLLSRRRFWQVVGYAVLLALLTGVLTGGIGALIGFGSQAFIATNPSTGALVAAQLVQVAFTTIATAIVTPFTIIAYLLFYFDLRVRTEGFDLTLKSQMNEDVDPADIVGDRVPDAGMAEPAFASVTGDPPLAHHFLLGRGMQLADLLKRNMGQVLLRHEGVLRGCHLRRGGLVRAGLSQLDQAATRPGRGAA